MAGAMAVTGDELKAALAGELPVAVEFWMEGCPACMRFAPTFDLIADEFAGRVTCVKIEAKQNLEVAKEMKIRGVPAVVVFVEGEEVQRQTGAKSLEEMREWLAPVG